MYLAAAFPHGNLACMRGKSARAEPDLPERASRDSGGLTPPPWVPRSRAETSATSAERRRTRPTPSTHTHTPRPHRRFVYINRTILSQCGFLNNETRSSQVREKRRAIVRSPEHCTKDQDQTHNGWNLKNNRTESQTHAHGGSDSEAGLGASVGRVGRFRKPNRRGRRTGARCARSREQSRRGCRYG